MLFFRKLILSSTSAAILVGSLEICKLAAQTPPNSADVSQIKPFDSKLLEPLEPPEKIDIPAIHPSIEMPENADQIRFQLQSVVIEGVTIFTKDELNKIWLPYVGKEISLETVWSFAHELKLLYHAKGYFLSWAVVPAQSIKNGIIRLVVTEAYIQNIVIDDNVEYLRQIKSWIREETNQVPIRSETLETVLLRLNNIPGIEYRAVLDNSQTVDAAGIDLVFNKAEEEGRVLLGFDNYSSKYLGPYKLTLFYDKSFIPLHNTTLMTTQSIPVNRLQQYSFKHDISLNPRFAFSTLASYVNSKPGGNIGSLGIESNSVTLEVGASYSAVMQRDETLRLSVFLAGKNTNGDIDVNPLTKDRVRALRLKAAYTLIDSWRGQHILNLQFNQGLDIAGASKAGDLNLSRSEADPDFKYFTLDYTRYQVLPYDFVGLFKLSSQYSTTPLFSSEEAGIGGMDFGRAYNSSEILGDHQLAGSIEIQYSGFESIFNLAYTPYAFYDLGKVWNRDSGSSDESAASAGFGIKLKHTNGLSANFGVAWPLTRPLEEPIYGDEKDPRLLLQVVWEM